MKYLLFTSKTNKEETVFLGVFNAENIVEAKKKVKKYSSEKGVKMHCDAASISEINFLKNDAKIREDKVSTLPVSFNLDKAELLSI